MWSASSPWWIGSDSASVHHAVAVREPAGRRAVLDPGEAGLAEDVAGPHHAGRDAPLVEELLHLRRGRTAPSSTAKQDRIHVVSAPSVVRPGVDPVARGEEVVEPLPVVACRWSLNALELLELHQAVRGADLGRLEVVADAVEQEHEVVGRAVGERAEPLLLALAGSRTGTTRCAGPSAGATGSGRAARRRRRRPGRRCRRR